MTFTEKGLAFLQPEGSQVVYATYVSEDAVPDATNSAGNVTQAGYFNTVADQFRGALAGDKVCILEAVEVHATTNAVEGVNSYSVAVSSADVVTLTHRAR